tara:strand:- start:218 stop:343 length:126 start_codon:yes stop_codon:yes gene_type:complete
MKSIARGAGTLIGVLTDNTGTYLALGAGVGLALGISLKKKC